MLKKNVPFTRIKPSVEIRFQDLTPNDQRDMFTVKSVLTGLILGNVINNLKTGTARRA